MARMSIYVPDELKGRIEQVTDVNWSAVAQRAFESELRLHLQWTESKMEMVIERIRASKAKQVDDVIKSGFEAGKNWAENIAEYLTLKHIGECNDIPYNYEEFDFETASKVFCKSPFLFFDAFDEIPDQYFQLGFARGAETVWKEIKDKL